MKPSADSTPSALPVSAGQAMAPGAASRMAVEDWDLLFRAVQFRLQCIAESGQSQASGLADSIMDCLSGLDQLRQAALNEFAQARRAEADGR